MFFCAGYCLHLFFPNNTVNLFQDKTSCCFLKTLVPGIGRLGAEVGLRRLALKCWGKGK